MKTKALLNSKSEEENSTFFQAVLSDNRVQAKVVTDQGADANFLPMEVLDEMCKVQPRLVIHDNMPPTVVKDVSGNLCVAWDHRVPLDVLLKILHGSNLILIPSPVTYQSTPLTLS